MKKSHILVGVCACVFSLISIQAAAELVPKLGGRVVYDDDRDITWLADANLAASNTFGVEGIATNPAGFMNWETANAFIEAMNAANYLGFNDWRLPAIQDPDSTCTLSDGTPVAGPEGYNCSGSEMGHLFYTEFGADALTSVLVTGDAPDLAKFSNVKANTYWSVEANIGSAWSFNFSGGWQGALPKENLMFVWPVRDGDVDTAPPAPPIATYLALGWEVTDFLTMSVPSRAIAFDSENNLYIEDTRDDSLGEIEVLQLTASSAYDTSSSYATYATVYLGATGLDFDDLGSLYVSERTEDGDAGVIREVSTVTQNLVGDVMAFARHRPSGVDADTSGNIFYSGRKDSVGTWGKIYKIDADGVRTILIDNVVAIGVAVDSAGDIFVSTPPRENPPLLGNSIYRFRSDRLLIPYRIATFDSRGGELTFDKDDNLYMVADDKVNIIKLTRTATGAVPWVPVLLE